MNKNKSVSAVLLVALGLTLSTAQAGDAASKGSAASAKVNADMANREANKKTVLAFYDAAVKLDFEAARQYVGDLYIEHDPERQDGLQGLEKAMDFDRRHNNRKNMVHELVVADGDLVAVYSKSTAIVGAPLAALSSSGSPAGGSPPSVAPAANAPAPQPDLVGDIFRLQDGKIVEHWNAIYSP
jgi:predicted SnoaL-like aldol condensation-catalyzing enzyme